VGVHRALGDLTIRWPVVLRGALVALAGIVPLAIISAAVDDPSDSDGGWRILIFFGVLACWFFAGSVAGSRALDAPLTHGALAALGAFFGWVVFRTVAGFVSDGEAGYEAWTVVSVGLFALACGLLGGVAGARRALSSNEDAARQ
jgi:hypothetical protein